MSRENESTTTTQKTSVSGALSWPNFTNSIEPKTTKSRNTSNCLEILCATLDTSAVLAILCATDLPLNGALFFYNCLPRRASPSSAHDQQVSRARKPSSNAAVSRRQELAATCSFCVLSLVCLAVAVFLPLSLLLKSVICRQSRTHQMHQFNLAKTHIHRPTRLQCFLLNLSPCLCLSGWLYSSLTLFIGPPRANRVIICLIVDSRRRGLSSQRATIANIVGKYTNMKRQLQGLHQRSL